MIYKSNVYLKTSYFTKSSDVRALPLIKMPGGRVHGVTAPPAVFTGTSHRSDDPRATL